MHLSNITASVDEQKLVTVGLIMISKQLLLFAY